MILFSLNALRNSLLWCSSASVMSIGCSFQEQMCVFIKIRSRNGAGKQSRLSLWKSESKAAPLAQTGTRDLNVAAHGLSQ